MLGSSVRHLANTTPLDPLADLRRIKSDQTPNLDVRNAPFQHQPTDEPDVHAELISQLTHADEVRMSA